LRRGADVRELWGGKKIWLSNEIYG
jgi:hypothetical protein